ncbi:cellulase family glycosylhydrolase [Pelagicoccus sp. SDUM812003]|uniref:glycoside hydrolase family 5 protein n=1 Tax=Pelagicoccus sp. SDUM812003 TaxID=3041267 RepID=UPI00280D0A70|nr:cellulase family glycosylhydrolase [Pelagicoccus sp. SDUM812003]MDQ8201371.1 cellulase family glycosylhydrolase [Pelagicoccus sp. SDUM812003]
MKPRSTIARMTRHLFAIIALIGIATTSIEAETSGKKAPLNPSGFAIQRGINLSHWLSQDFGWSPRETFITENDIQYLAGIGYDHVRLPLDEKEMWDAEGNPIEASFAYVEKAIEWCQAHDLRIVVDLHTINAHHFNAANEGLENTLWTDPAAQEGFFDLWRDLSARLHHYPVDLVAYEIMNEPVAEDHEDWNRLVETALKTIRELEPDRVIVIGANMWQIPVNVPKLRIPENDKNIILSTHVYAPLAFTHYKANWTPFQVYEGPVSYPGAPITQEVYDALVAENPALADLLNNAREDWGPERLAAEFAPAIEHARKLGLQLYCGEFGCLPTVPREQRLAYYRDLLKVLEDNDVAWANWEYKGDFGIFEWHSEITSIGAPDLDMIEVLTGTRPQ